MEKNKDSWENGTNLWMRYQIDKFIIQKNLPKTNPVRKAVKKILFKNFDIKTGGFIESKSDD